MLSSLLPPWGCFSGARMNSVLDEIPPTVVVSGATREAGSQLASYATTHRFQTVALEGDNLRGLIDSIKADAILLATTAQAALFDPRPLVARAPKEIIKASVDGTPMDLYAVRKRVLLSVLMLEVWLSSYLPRSLASDELARESVTVR